MSNIKDFVVEFYFYFSYKHCMAVVFLTGAFLATLMEHIEQISDRYVKKQVLFLDGRL